ncbi:Hsp70 family protein [Virgisporangium aurantiacum]|uniref:Hsp70 protein n=1 Tax=Virgisporangium aurantiacum TaxID=175570 RepID=A0A8J3ZFV3_9ACTN|nr:Hsp70 family protein [Virgisporangium aurantiacum]GIJ60831.1 hypothetical protein Vau01_083470 [Virgisporangium aurantiacum]
MPEFDAGHTLGVDIGSSTTVAAARTPDGRVRILPVLRTPRTPDHEALLAEVRAGLRRKVRPELILTYPHGWDGTRQATLVDAARAAGFDAVRVIAGPLAAAAYYTSVLGRPLPFGAALVVHDLGATFDVAVVVRRALGLEVVAAEHRDVGGAAIDRGIVRYIGGTGPVWQSMREPVTDEDRRLRDQLWDAVRTAKEQLSTATSARFTLARRSIEVELTRGVVDRLVEPVVRETMEVTRDLVRTLTPTEDPIGILYIGGTTRVPRLAAALAASGSAASGSAASGSATAGNAAPGNAVAVTVDRPETVLAHGAAVAAAADAAHQGEMPARRWWRLGR